MSTCYLDFENVEGTLTPVIRTLEALGTIMDERACDAFTKLSATRITPVNTLPACDICGCDARWDAESWMRSYVVHLCDEHMHARSDQYKSLTRIEISRL